jgi:Trk K+ transport system NAD-binding subunit
MRKGRLRYQIGFWAGAISLVIGVGVIYFPQEFNDKSIWETLYYTLRLFIFEHDHAYFPTKIPLILIYFIAPLITLSGIGTAVSYLLSLSPFLKIRWMKDHVIVCGMGRTGRLFAEALKSQDISIVGVDLFSNSDIDEWRDRHSISILAGDFHSETLLKKAGVQRARSVVYASGDDLINLEGALSAYGMINKNLTRPRLIWAQITDEQMADTARFFLRTTDNVGIRIFDTYRIAAEKMVEKHFNPARRNGIREVDIMGFGKFGRDLTEVLIRKLNADNPLKIRVIDIRNCEPDVMALAAKLNYAEHVVFEQANIRDLPALYHKGKASFICTDDDLKNLTAAMSLARSYDTNHIYVRMSRWPLPAVSEHIGEKHGIRFVNISELVLEGIRGLAGVFRAAEAWDLKRTAPRLMPGLQATDGPNRMKLPAFCENKKFGAGSLS